MLILTKNSNSPYPKPSLRTFLGPRGHCGECLQTEPLFGWNSNSVRTEKAVRSRECLTIAPRDPKTSGWGFRVRRVRIFCQNARSTPHWGCITPYCSKQPADNSPFRDWISERSPDSNSPQNLGPVSQNFGSRGIFTRR